MKYFLAFLASLFFHHANAQNEKMYKKVSASISAPKKEMLFLDTIRNTVEPSLHLPFNSFIVKDVTADSSYIAVKIIKAAMRGRKTYDKLSLQNGTGSSITKYLNNKPNVVFTASAESLTCYLKKVRITDVDTFNKALNHKELFTKVRFEAEGYLNKENLYFPAVRLDTTAISVATEDDFYILKNILEQFALKAALMDTARIFKRNGYSILEVENRYQQRHKKPVLQAPQLQKGVYKTFQDFASNNPSIKQYQFKKDETAAILYIEDGTKNWIPERKVYGYCDGKVAWINVNNIFYPLVRQGNTFEFLADYDLVNNKGPLRNRNSNLVTGDMFTSLAATAIAIGKNQAMADETIGKIVFQLDMETGQFY